jgi:hypothetical protein
MRTHCILIIFVLAAVLSCKKEKPGNGPFVQGNISVQITAMHHSWSVSGITVFIRKDATEWPGEDTTLYTARATTDNGGNAVFSNLFHGNYYIYAKGYDKLFGTDVYGYMPVNLNASSVSNNEAYFRLYVNEK